jgi:mono/diheme cytochrome c family protein
MLTRTVVWSFLAVSMMGLSACKDPVMMEEPFTESQVLGGETVSIQALDNGRQMYVRHCRACHGFTGDGRGPSSPGLRPAPRDLREAKFKFSRMQEGDLPSDVMLYEIIRNGLHGTAMLDWEIPDEALADIIDYIKTFSPEGEGWRDPDNEVGTPLEISDDSWAGKDEEAIKLGKRIFHGKANCQSCHPAYATKKYQWGAFKSYNMKPTFRDDMYHAKPTPTEPGEAKSEYSVNGVEQWFKPPDYTWDDVRTLAGSSDTRQSLYRIIGAGVNGTAMARWKGTLDEEELWAVAYYVESLVKMRDTPRATKHRQRLMNQAPWEPPQPPPTPEAEANNTEG